MDHSELVSVIIPTCNRAQYLKQAVVSVINQSYKNTEIIIISNGCQDNSNDIIHELQTTYPSNRIVHLDFAETLGGAKARNIGINKSSGTYTAFLDDDDIWHRDKLMTQIEILNRNQYAIIGTNYFYICGQQCRPAKKARKQILGIKDLYYENVLGSFSFCITKKSYINNNHINENLNALQDWDLWLKILNHTALPAFISNQRLAYQRINHNRLSTDSLNIIKAQQEFLDTWRGLLDEPGVNYHKMRTRCLELRNQHKSWRDHIRHLGFICKTVFFSPDRYNLKRYIHYIFQSVINTGTIQSWQIWRWKKFS